MPKFKGQSKVSCESTDSWLLVTNIQTAVEASLKCNMNGKLARSHLRRSMSCTKQQTDNKGLHVQEEMLEMSVGRFSPNSES